MRLFIVWRLLLFLDIGLWLCLTACDSDLKLETIAVEADCGKFPDASECLGSPAVNLTFEILTKTFVTNAKDAEFHWSSMGPGFAYEVVVASNEACKNILDRYTLFERKRTIGLLGNGRYFICVFGENNGVRKAAENNPVAFTVDRQNPLISNSAEAAAAVPTNTPKLPEVTVTDNNTFQVEWSQKDGQGILKFSDKNNLFSQISASDDGVYVVTLTVKDAAGNTAIQDYQLNIDTRAPVVDAGDDITGSGASQMLSGSYVGDAANIFWSMVSGPEGGVLTFGNTSALATTVFGGVTGIYVIRLAVTDGAGNTGTDTLVFNWNQADRRPNLQPIPDQSVEENSAIAPVDADDAGDDKDIDGTDLTYLCLYDTTVSGSIVGGSDCEALPGSASFFENTGVLTWTPDYTAADAAVYEIAITASDGTLSDSELFLISVTNTNRAPVITAIADATVYEESAIAAIDAEDSNTNGDIDIDGTAISWSCVYDTNNDGSVSGAVACDTLAGSTFDVTTGIFSWTPVGGATQISTTYEFMITASDGDLSAAEIFVLVVGDNIDPSDPSSVAASTNSFKPIITYEASVDSNFQTHEVKVCSDSGCLNNCSDVFLDFESPLSLTSDLANSQYYACVRGADITGNHSNWAVSSPFIIDVAVASFDPLPAFTQEGIRLSWTDGDPNGSAGYLIYRQNSGTGDITWEPADNMVYTTDSDITSDSGANNSAQIVYVGSAYSVTDARDLVDNTAYLYKIFPFNSNHEYGSGLQRISRTYPYQTVDTGGKNICATRFGRLRCFGDNNASGSLGYQTGDAEDIGDDEYPYEVGDVEIGKDVLAVAVSPGSNLSKHTCVLTIEGKVRCFGENASGQLGNNTTNDITPATFPPPDVNLPVIVVAVDVGGYSLESSAAGHTCVLTNRGGVRCWGEGSYGAVGYDTTGNIDGSGTFNTGVYGSVQDDVETIPDVAVGTTAVLLDLGDLHSCVVTVANKGRCWGSNQNGRLGLDSDMPRVGSSAIYSISNIADINLSAEITQISAGGSFTCAVTEPGGGRCWGDGLDGRLGNAGTVDVSDGSGPGISTVTDIDIDNGSDQVLAAIGASGDNTCALSLMGFIKCWGRNNLGQTGYGNTVAIGDNETPINLDWHDFGSKVVQLAAGGSGSQGSNFVVLTESGEIYTWGNNGSGSLGNKTGGNWGDDLGELATDLSPVPLWGPVQAAPNTLQVSNLLLWLDASDSSTLHKTSGCADIAESEDTVSCWQDKSGRGNHALSTGSYQPILKEGFQHGNAALWFDGQDDYLGGNIIGMSSGDIDYTIFIVYRGDDPPSIDYEVVFSFGNSWANAQNVGLSYGNYTGPQSSMGQYDNDRTLGTLEAAKTYVTSIRYIAPGGITLEGWHNGVFANSGSLGSAKNMTMAADPLYRVGQASTGENNLFQGHIMEFIVYDVALADADREAIDAYLRAKWQKGVDGISTHRLSLHLDPMKVSTVKSDANATICDPATHTQATDGSGISCILDRSVNKDHAGQGTTASRPIYDLDGMNSNPSIVFDGSDDWLVGELGTWDAANKPWSVQQAFFSQALGSNYVTFGMGDVDAERQKFQALIKSSTEIAFGLNSGVIDYSGLAELNGSASVLSHSYQGGQYGNLIDSMSYLNGFLLSGNESANEGNGQFPLTPAYSIGSNSLGANFYSGHITETLFYDRGLSSTEIVENNLYLMRKWGHLENNKKAPGGVFHGLILWLDADDRTSLSTASCASLNSEPSDSQNIECWRDKSGRGNDLIASTPPTFETGEFNGRPAIKFSGSDFMTQASLKGMYGADNPFTVFIVYDTAVLAQQYLLAFGSESDKQRWGLKMNFGSLQSFFRQARVSTNDQVAALTNIPYLVTMSYTGGGVKVAASQPIYLNGKNLVDLGFGGTATGEALIPNEPPVTLGSRLGGNDKYTGLISEVIFYNRLLSAPERQAVEAYLAQKWLEEAYKSGCQELEDAGETSDGNYVIDPDGYNGPAASQEVYCDFP